MINIVAESLITAQPPKGCVCNCYSPGCQENECYLEGYAEGTADAELKYNPQL